MPAQVQVLLALQTEAPPVDPGSFLLLMAGGNLKLANGTDDFYLMEPDNNLLLMAGGVLKLANGTDNLLLNNRGGVPANVMYDLSGNPILDMTWNYIGV